jgi:hypothetical protein
MAVRDTDNLRGGLNPASFLRPRRGRRRGGETNVSAPIIDTSTLQDEQIVSDEVSDPIENNFISNVETPSIDVTTPHLRYIRNPYPSALGENPVLNYTRENGMIKFTGKYPENFLKFNEYPLGDVTKTEGTYDFVIQFMDGTLYTSAPYYDELQLEFNVGNPYRNLQTIPTVKVDDTLLGNYASLAKFSIGEQYAEMDMMNNIDTKLEIIKHIDWLSSDVSELRTINSMGKFQHQQTDDLGFALQSQLDGIENDPNAPGEESTIEAEIIIPTPPIVTEPTDNTRDPLFDTSNFNGLGNIGNLPRGNKIICGELYRQGFLSEEVWEADQEFGKLLYKTNPRIMLGYTYWAREVVKYMKNNPTHTKYLYKIFRPWTEHMAYKMGVTNKPNLVGNITQKIGYAYSMIVYNYYQIKWKRFRFTI